MISVHMPCYNAGSYICQSIDSLFAQTYTDWQLIIVDDGSTDNTASVIQKYLSDKRVRYIKIEHAGCPVARNVCYQESTGVYIARWDADDWSTNDRLAKSINYLENNDVDLVSCKMYRYFSANRIVPDKCGAIVPAEYVKGFHLHGPVCASLVSYAYVYDKINDMNGFCFDPAHWHGSDGVFNEQCLHFGFKFGFIDEFLYYYRQHASQITVRKRLTNH